MNVHGKRSHDLYLHLFLNQLTIAVMMVMLGTCWVNGGEVPLLVNSLPAVKSGFMELQDGIVTPGTVKVASPFSKAPAPGVHPRTLISPDDLPALRRRWFSHRER